MVIVSSRTEFSFYRQSDLVMKLHFPNESSSERRAFLRSSAMATVAIPLVAQLSQANDADPNAIGIIGVGGMGMNHLNNWLAEPTFQSPTFVMSIETDFKMR